MATNQQTQRRSGRADQISIADAIQDPFDWLEHQAEGNKPAVKRKALQHIEDAGGTEVRTRTDYVGRFAIELLQNAHDACADADRQGAVRFVLTETALLVANEGVAFDGPRIVSLVRQGTSEKAEGYAGRRTIGYKGLGFSSVFQISDHPQVVSAGEAWFQFDRDRAAQLVRDGLGLKPKRVAARAFPFRMQRSDLRGDAATVDELLADGAVTVIRLPIRGDPGVDAVEKMILDTIRPQVLVFMPAVNRLELRLPSGTQNWARREGQGLWTGRVVHLDGVPEGESSWLTKQVRVPVTASEAHALGEPAWEGVRTAEFKVGLPWSKGVSGAERLSPIHVYFPTDERTGRSILLHGDFVIDSRRAQIQMKGPAGELNKRFAERAAGALADLAQAACTKYSPEVCAALAKSGATTAFGDAFNSALIPELKKRRVLRVYESTSPVAVGRAQLPTDLGVKWERRLLAVIRRKRGLLKPDYSNARAGLLLEELELRTIEPAELAKRIRVPASAKKNEQALAMLQEWCELFPRSARWPIYDVLGELRLLRDTDGELRRADEVVLSTDAGPPLPPTLRKHQLAPISEPLVEDLIYELGVEPLSNEGALEFLLQALEDRKYGRKAAEHETILRFCRELWQADAAVLRAAHDRLGQIRLPARRGSTQADDSPKSVEAWVAADETYLGAGWHPLGEKLERLYGPLGRTEFLALVAPAGAGLRREREFFITLGVADKPRSLLVTPSTAERYDMWESDPELQAAFACDDGHPNSERNVQSKALDRLDKLLGRVGRDGGALADLLASLDDPYGGEAEVRCQNAGHRGLAKPKKARGYQRWLLQRMAWVPVTNDPEARRHRPPSEAWTGMPRATSRMLIPDARLGDASASLELVNWTRPTPAEVERLLVLLKKSKAEAAIRDETADTLLHKLDTIVARLKTERTPIEVLSFRGRERAWTDNPLIPDLPRLSTLEDIHVLPPGSWAGLRRAYGFPLASEVVQQKVFVTGEDLATVPLLPARARLLALLLRSAEDAETLALRLKRLQERPVRAFELRLSMNGVQRSTSALTAHLVKQPAKPRRLPSGVLYWTPQALTEDRPALIRLLSDYLQLSDPSPLGFFLKAPDEALRTNGVRKADIEEAAELLRKRRGAPERRPAFEVMLPNTDPGVEPVSVGPGATARQTEPESRTSAPSSSLPQRPSKSSTLRDSPKRNGQGASPAIAPQPESLVFGNPTPLASPATSPPGPGSTRTGGPPTNAGPPAELGEREGRLGGDPRSDAITEKCAVDYVRAYASAVLGVTEIRDVQRDNMGWDLEFVLPDGTEQLVEVKGSRGSSAFAITRNELAQAKVHRNYVLYFVCDLGARPRMIRIDDFGSKISVDQLTAYQWAVPGWRQLQPIEIPLSMAEQGAA